MLAWWLVAWVPTAGGAGAVSFAGASVFLTFNPSAFHQPSPSTLDVETRASLTLLKSHRPNQFSYGSTCSKQAVCAGSGRLAQLILLVAS